MSFLVVPLHPQHHAGAEALIRAAAPERGDCVRSWPSQPAEPRGDGYVRLDYIAVEASAPEQPVGYGAIWPQGEGRFRMDLMVTPDRQRQGVGAMLLQRLLEALRAQRARIVQARTPDYRTESLNFLKRRGFTETNRMIRLRLQVASASLSELPILTAHLAAQGISIVTLEQEQTQCREWLARLLDLICATGPERVGNPYGVGAETQFWSMEVARQAWQSTLPLSADACFLAIKGDVYIGLSVLCQGNAPGELAQGETGVHVDWRRQGVATLLKLHTIAYARQHGYDAITTMTASPGMLALNERLGFQPGWAEVRLVRKIEEV